MHNGPEGKVYYSIDRSRITRLQGRGEVQEKALEADELSPAGVRGESGQRELEEPGEGLGAILDALPATVGYWDAEQRNRVANRAYVEFFGLTPEQIRGRRISEVLGPELYALNRPYIERALAGEPQLFDRTIIDPSGAPRYTQASYIPDVVDGKVRGFVVLVTDITERRVAEQARAAAEARFRLAFTCSPVGMSVMDRAGRMLQVNPALCEMLGYGRGARPDHPVLQRRGRADQR
jgi:PAS domain S-box-containing protein